MLVRPLCSLSASIYVERMTEGAFVLFVGICIRQRMTESGLETEICLKMENVKVIEEVGRKQTLVLKWQP